MEEETMVTDWDDLGVADMDSLFEDPIPNNIVDNNEGQPPLDVIENLPFNDDQDNLLNEFFNDIFVTESPAPSDVVVVDDRQQKDAPPDVVVVVDDRQQKDAPPDVADSADRDKSSCSGSHSVSLTDLNMELMWNKNKISFEKRTVPLSSELRYLTPLSVSRNEEPQEKLYLPGSSHSVITCFERGAENITDAEEKSNGLKRGRKRKIDLITMEAVQKHFGKPIGQAAESIGVTRSTLKRFCRENGIFSWPLDVRRDRQQKDAPPDVVVVDDRQQKEEDNSHKDDPLAKERKRQSYVKELEMKSSFYEAECRRLMAENQELRFSLHSSKLTFDTTSITKQVFALLFLALLTEQQEVLRVSKDQSAADGTSQSVVPYLDVGAEDSNIYKGEMERKRKRSETSISLEEISKHYGKTFDEAAKNLSVSRSTLNRICRGYGIVRWPPYKSGSDKSNSLLKSNQIDLLNWNFESPPSPIALLTEQQEVLRVSKDQSAADGTSQSVVPYLDVGAEDSNIYKGEMERKKKRSETSISLEEISKHYGKTINEAAKNLSVSRSTLKRICRGYGILRWPYKSGSDKSNSLLKSNQTDVVAVHVSEGALTPIIEAFNEPLVTTNVSHDPTIRIEHGKQSSTLVLHQQEQTNLTAGPAQPETSTKEQFIENTTAANAMKNLTIKATYKDDIVKFPFTISDGLVKLRELVAIRFRLSLGSFRLLYKGADDDMILIECDDDLMGSVIECDSDLIRLLVSPVIHQSPDA